MCLGMSSLFCLHEHEHDPHFRLSAFFILGMGLFRATLLERAARYTQTCFATLTVSVFLFPTWAVLFRSQFARFHIALHRVRDDTYECQ